MARGGGVGGAGVDGGERLAEQVGGQDLRVLHADAAVAELAVDVTKNVAVGRVVQEHVELVRHIQHQQAEPGIGAGELFGRAPSSPDQE